MKITKKELNNINYLKLNTKDLYIDNFSDAKRLQSIKNTFFCNIISFQQDENTFNALQKAFREEIKVGLFYFDENNQNINSLNEVIFKNKIDKIDIIELFFDKSGYRILEVLCDTEYIQIVEKLIIHNSEEGLVSDARKKEIIEKLLKSHKKKYFNSFKFQEWSRISTN